MSGTGQEAYLIFLYTEKQIILTAAGDFQTW